MKPFSGGDWIPRDGEFMAIRMIPAKKLLLRGIECMAQGVVFICCNLSPKGMKVQKGSLEMLGISMKPLIPKDPDIHR